MKKRNNVYVGSATIHRSHILRILRAMGVKFTYNRFARW